MLMTKAPLTEDEEKERKKRMRWIMELQDQKAIKQHREDMNYCPKCRMTRTLSGKCSMGCDD